MGEGLIQLLIEKSPYFGFLINEFERMGSGFKNSPFLSQTTNFMLIKKLWDLFDFKTSKLWLIRCLVNLEVAFADRLVLEEVVRVPQGFVAHVALQFGFLSFPHLISSYNQSFWWFQRGHYLHAFWMIIGSVVLDTVPDYLLLTHTALFLTSLPTKKASAVRKITTRES